MPIRSASRRIESASSPSSSRIVRAAPTISFARGLNRSGTPETIARAETVSHRPVEADVEAPDERTDQVGAADDSRCRECEQNDRGPEAVKRVVERHGARIELPAREAAADADEEREVRADRERAELPVPRPLPDDLEDDREDEERGDGEVGELPGRSRARDGCSGLHSVSFVVANSVSLSMANGVSRVKCRLGIGRKTLGIRSRAILDAGSPRCAADSGSPEHP